MEIFRYLKRTLQVVAVAIFAYQMLVAMKNYLEFSSYPSLETKDIADVNLLDFFICLKEDDAYDYVNLNGKHGYAYANFLLGFVNGSEDFVSWEGPKNLTYDTVIKELFLQIGELKYKSQES